MPCLAVPVMSARARMAGASLIEVLVTLVILAVGLLGLVGLLIQSQRSQVESYQRAQALIVLDDMVNRINVNRKVAGCYAISMSNSTTSDGGKFLGGPGAVAPVATTNTTLCPSSATKDWVNTDLEQWNNMLLGSSEKTANSPSADNVGAMIGARGCIEKLASPDNTYRVSVAWQGLGPTLSRPSSPCASGLYGGSDDSQRRVVSTTLQIATLASLP